MSGSARPAPDEQHVQSDADARAAPRRRVSTPLAIGCGLALWLLVVPALYVAALVVGVGRGLSNRSTGVLPGLIFWGGLGVVVLATIWIVVRAVRSSSERRRVSRASYPRPRHAELKFGRKGPG